MLQEREAEAVITDMGRPVKESAIFEECASMRMRLSSAVRLFDFDESAVFFRLFVDCVFAVLVWLYSSLTSVFDPALAICFL